MSSTSKLHNSPTGEGERVSAAHCRRAAESYRQAAREVLTFPIDQDLRVAVANSLLDVAAVVERGPSVPASALDQFDEDVLQVRVHLLKAVEATTESGWRLLRTAHVFLRLASEAVAGGR
ncbi:MULTISPECIES: hypothetical protein [Actinosynnema]|uniref:hypothetical protein n=1 Tax=Actinosynnema TaxID=40566 RepID=UPI0020A50112|nr:hypothetical protein [Actinosynnema pretiosum]MCP2093349.1 hypothetical protein [Actinosynnema pretiosum]